MKNVVQILVLVFAVCSLIVGTIYFFPLSQDTAYGQMEISDEPVAMGAETSPNASLLLLCEGRGTIEVSPYRQGFYSGETLKLTAHAEDGWTFSRWEGDIPVKWADTDKISVQLAKGEYEAIAVFVENQNTGSP